MSFQVDEGEQVTLSGGTGAGKKKNCAIITMFIYKSKKTIKKSPIIRNTIVDFLCIMDIS